MASLFSVFKYVRPRKVIKSDDFNGLQDSIKASFDSLGTALTVLDPVGHLGVSTPFHVDAPVDNEHAATKLYVDTSYGTNAANLAAALVAQTAAEAAQAAADADVVTTNANAASTAADVVTTTAKAAATALDAAATAADVLATNADVVTTNANAAATTLDAASTAADVLATNADVVTTNANAAATSADVVTTTAKAAATALDAAATAADVLATNADVLATNANAAATSADVVTVAGIYDLFDDRVLGTFAVAPTLDNDGNPLVAGAIYYDSALAKLRVYSGTAWASIELYAHPNHTGEVTSTGDGDTVISDTVKADLKSGRKNAVINGNFDVWQRGASFSGLVTNSYTADRWVLLFNGSGSTRTVDRVAFTLGQTDVPNNPEYYYKYNISVAGTGATVNYLRQFIEGVETFAGETVTLSFYARVATGTQDITPSLVQYFGTGGSPSSSVANDGTVVSLTTSWQKFTRTIALTSISGKTLGSSGDDSLQLRFALPLNTAAEYHIAQVQLEKGSAATDFERRTYGEELELCQRYYYEWTLANQGIKTELLVGAATNTVAIGVYSLPVPMRAAPTISTTSLVATGMATPSSLTYGRLSGTHLSLSWAGTWTAPDTGIFYFDLTADAEL